MALAPGTPRISVNKLGEYLVVGPGRRNKILYDAKFPSDFLRTLPKDWLCEIRAMQCLGGKRKYYAEWKKATERLIAENRKKPVPLWAPPKQRPAKGDDDISF